MTKLQGILEISRYHVYPSTAPVQRKFSSCQNTEQTKMIDLGD